jgi:hypothetical protein
MSRCRVEFSGTSGQASLSENLPAKLAKVQAELDK